MEKNELLAYAHKECSSAGQSAIPGDDEEANLHFVAFVEMQGKLWELDGRKPGPVCHGECTDLLMGSVKVVKEFMQRDPEQLHFTAIALAPVGED